MHATVGIHMHACPADYQLVRLYCFAHCNLLLYLLICSCYCCTVYSNNYYYSLLLMFASLSRPLLC